MPLPRLLIPLLALASGIVSGGGMAAAQALTVFAAASLSDAMVETGENFRASQGVEVKFLFASSSTLARQIEAGAPAGIVALASEEWMDYLAERGAILPETRSSPIGNRLVLIAPAGGDTAVAEPLTADALTAALGPAGRMTLGDPAHVPAGIYAREALQNLGLWTAVSGRLALTDNVRAALALVARGEAALGVVYATDAPLANDVRVLAALPASSHRPVTYPVAITSDGDSAGARAFLAYLASEDGLSVFRRFGFTGN